MTFYECETMEGLTLCCHKDERTPLRQELSDGLRVCINITEDFERNGGYLMDCPCMSEHPHRVTYSNSTAMRYLCRKPVCYEEKIENV